jgi:hypothetical protein
MTSPYLNDLNLTAKGTVYRFPKKSYAIYYRTIKYERRNISEYLYTLSNNFIQCLIGQCSWFDMMGYKTEGCKIYGNIIMTQKKIAFHSLR